jgi:hypothetical protein
VTISYSRAARGATTVSAGMIYYGNLAAPDTTELYGHVSRDMVLNPSLTFYYDVDEGDGAVALLSIGQDLPLLADVRVSLSAAASYNINHKIMGTGFDQEPFAGFYHGELGIGVSVPVTPRLTLAPRILYTFPLTSTASHAMKGASYDGNTGALLSGGIGFAIEF